MKTNEIPSWLRAGLDVEAADGVLNKRTEPRHGWVTMTRARLARAPNTELISVKTYNVSRSGLCLITRKQLHDGTELVLTPMHETGEPVRVRVVHCKQTIQGYKVGCEFVVN